MALILQETLRGLLYSPFYLALSLGAFRNRGLDVDLVSSPNPGDAAIRVLDGTVNVNWGGPLRVLETYEARPDCDLICFGEVVTRDPFFLLGREPNPAFTLSNLRGLRLATTSEVPTPWLCLQEDLRRAGVYLAEVQIIAGRTMGQNADALRAGEIDVIQVFEPFVEALVNEGSGHIWHCAANRGPTSYTTFYARKAFLQHRRDEALNLVRGIYRMQSWMQQASVAQIVAAVQSFFPAEPPARLCGAIERYQSSGIWGTNPRLPRVGYERLQHSLLACGFLRQGMPYERVVDNSLADQVIAEEQRADGLAGASQ